MWPEGKLAPRVTAQSAPTIARWPDSTRRASRGAFLLVEEPGPGRSPFSGEKLSPVLTVYRARDFAPRSSRCARSTLPGRGHSVGYHGAATRTSSTSASICRSRA
jgi:sulfoacetaldehyde dehydrogenase